MNMKYLKKKKYIYILIDFFSMMSFLCFIACENSNRAKFDTANVTRIPRYRLNKTCSIFLSQNASAQRISVRETNQITHQGASLIIQSSWRHRLSAEPIGPNSVCDICANVYEGNRSCDPSHKSRYSIFDACLKFVWHMTRSKFCS